MSFTIRHWNRQTMPTKHVLVCEDNLGHQQAIAQHLASLWPSEGNVQVSYVPGALMGATILWAVEVDLILLDHDMPHGSGSDFLTWLGTHFSKLGRPVPDIITFSGIPENNTHMKSLHPQAHLYSKSDVLLGKADALMNQILGM